MSSKTELSPMMNMAIQALLGLDAKKRQEIVNAVCTVLNTFPEFWKTEPPVKGAVMGPCVLEIEPEGWRPAGTRRPLIVGNWNGEQWEWESEGSVHRLIDSVKRYALIPE